VVVTEQTHFTVEGVNAGQRLDRCLAARKTWGSRSQVQRLVAAAQVYVDGQPAKAGMILRRGQEVVVEATPPPRPANMVEPEPIPLVVLYEDEWLLVIDKPAGLVVHPAPGHWHGTLVNALLYHWHGARPGLDPTRPGIVHRLDKNTSGVLAIAKDPETLAALAAQFRLREVRKEYIAAVWGRMPRRSGTIDAPIGRNPVHRQRMAVRPGGRVAQTRFEVIDRFASITFVRLFPTTGRTHQLRVHLAAIGHPIVGDSVYGRGRAREAGVHIARQALHAARLTFHHPRHGTELTCSASLPPDMRALRVEWARLLDKKTAIH
jgi:23S rRNA pseudouridine1911/1915/1917 synthase